MFPTLRTATFTALTLGLLAATASAQSGPPGSCDCAIPAAPIVVAAQPELPRWSIGLRVGGMTLAPEDRPEAETEYAVGGMQLRYRLRPRWQLELSLDHAQEKLEDGTDGTRELASVTFSALYHFRPYARWDWYLLAGLGGTVDGSPELSDEMREETSQGHFHLGVGVERRWNHFALSAELRAVGMAPHEHEGHGDDMILPAAATSPGSEDVATTGGMFSIGASYHF